MTWFRIHDDVINDPKVLKLPEATRWHWLAVLCVASKHEGILPPTSDLALLLRVTPAKAGTIITALVHAKLLDFEDGQYQPHNWKGRQYKTDAVDPTAAQRQKKHRAQKGEELRQLRALRDMSHNALRNGVGHVPLKRPDTEKKDITTTVSVERGLGKGNLSLSSEALKIGSRG